MGLLDGVDTAVLNSVDAIVFDGDSSLEMRKEALMFMMDHTEGFDFLVPVENADTASVPKSKKSTKKQSLDDSTGNLARRRLSTLALETLVEFVEEHAHIALQALKSDSLPGETSVMYKITGVLFPMAVQLIEAIESISASHMGKQNKSIIS